MTDNAPKNDKISSVAYYNGASGIPSAFKEFYPSGVYAPIELPVLDFLNTGDLKQGEESSNISRDITTYAGANGTLGNFTATLEGKISLDNEGNKEFNGIVTFNDIYDSNAANRPWFAELQVTVARNALPGTPFSVTGQLPVRQKFGGVLEVKSENGLYYINPVRTGFEQMPAAYREAAKIGTAVTN
ncbi:hypothetical protein [Kordia sp.]|uniref:hypothetical protein n=1 Tax=Kordia sp. TaxID=1965332 RepID=UPI003B5ACA1F